MGFPTNGPDRLTPLSEIDMRSLAEVSDDMDIHLSIYLPTASSEEEGLNRSFVSARVEAITNALAGEIEELFLNTYMMVEDLMYHDPIPGERGRVIFASDRRDFLRSYRLGVEPPRLLVLDNSPFILPLAKLMDDFEDYGIILMDSQEAKLFSVRSRIVEEVETASIDLMNRHKKGGMSQKRFNRLRRGQIESFVSEIIDDLERLDEMGDLRGIVLAGPGKEKKLLLDALPKRLADMVIGTVDVDIDVPIHTLMARGEEIASSHEDGKERSAMDRLRSAIFKDRLATTGVDETLTALVQGRVGILLIEDHLSIKGWICERCKNVHEGTDLPTTCPECGGPTSGADIVEEMYELAERMGVEVEVVDPSAFMDSIGRVGAILRY
jgi:peptide chain release factor subunit 1